LDFEEAHSCSSLFAFLLFEALRTKYGDRFVKEFCENSEVYPLMGVAAITLEANVAITCPEMAEMFKRADYPPHLKSLVEEACKGRGGRPKEEIIEEFLRECNTKGLKDALQKLTEFKLETLNDKENEILNVAFGRLPQAVSYAQKYDVDVSKPVMQSVLLMSMFISNVLKEVREELERCERSYSASP